ncbi:hypothetical protein HYH03_018691 [Edaphochlamys debaryana]|uniref:Pherophorin domain-containing protein n=1 Tax=Edaphochlamys debaryana TaxID=47281 RepID=A0A835XET0_9CHLO|nr:hypothetical protein HYH03_018691 [Edaphochlamys debaryana]|eukprot:KAG2482371.1 hypothetical protein HYH03_018691 [Edaphochlamys debaryana]
MNFTRQIVSNVTSGDWRVCFSLRGQACRPVRGRCCGTQLELAQFLIADNCYGSVYDVLVDGNERSPNYHVYDFRGWTYTTLKFNRLGLTPSTAKGQEICFSVRGSTCPDLDTLCKGYGCQVALGNVAGQEKEYCCPYQKVTWPQP